MKILAVDGNSIINRAFYGIRLLTTKSGEYTNGIYGFMNILNRLIEVEQPDGVCVAFDLRKPTFRHQKYAEYKAGRKPMPPELASQMPVLKELLTAFGYTCLEKEGYEADDILGTLAKRCEQSGNICVISTGDRDSFQLVSDTTKVLLASTKQGAPQLTVIDRAEIFARYGVEPQGMIEMKALQGDASDHIPGVAGVGEKTAADLIRRFENIDTIYSQLDTLDIKDSLRAKLAAGRDSAYLSRELGTIYTEVPLDKDIESLRNREPDTAALRKLLSRLEFFSLLSKLGLEEEEAVTPDSVAFSCLQAFPQTAEACDIYIVNDALLSLCSGRGVYACEIGAELQSLAALLADEKIDKRVNDAKWLYRFGLDNGIEVRNVTFDSSLAGYLLNPSASNYAVERLAAEYGVGTPAITGGGEPEKQGALFSLLCEEMEKQIATAGQSALLREIEIPLAQVLADMEKTGFLVDCAGISAYGVQLQQKIEEQTARIYDAVGYAFNLNSPKQLGEALFEKLGLPCKKKTKTGYSTNAEVLEGLRDAHPVISDLLEYRHLAKLKSTYCDSLTEVADQNGRIHSTLNQTETRTGRLSSTEPNLQNIPVRRPEGRELRRFFKASEGCVLCDADYSQIELRVLAHAAEDAAMIEAFQTGADIHTITASQVFGLPPEMVTPLMRSRAKAVNFGIVYGIGAFSLAKDIGVTRKEAEAYINSYFQTYIGVQRYMEQMVLTAKENGYVTTLFGRRRLLPELSSSNGMLRAFGERVARNMPIQGTAADIIKIAMVRVYSRLKRELPAAHIIMQVHDELIIEVPEAQAEAAARLLKEEMENAVQFAVPMLADVHIGKTWYEAKEA
ncbi:MAG: DNA polymerase I [Clostridia bacterium]|nr:DNA polymerase I [Clostridia bacterium]